MQSLADVLNQSFGPLAASLFGSITGRMMYHTGEVKKKRRKFFGIDLVWEIPVVLGMWWIGLGIASYFSLSEEAAAGLIVALAYLGPRGITAGVLAWFNRSK